VDQAITNFSKNRFGSKQRSNTRCDDRITLKRGSSVVTIIDGNMDTLETEKRNILRKSEISRNVVRIGPQAPDNNWVSPLITSPCATKITFSVHDSP
jgi:hypothetical protein